MQNFLVSFATGCFLPGKSRKDPFVDIQQLENKFSGINKAITFI